MSAGGEDAPLERLDRTVQVYLAIVADDRIPEKVRLHDLRHMAFWHGYYWSVVGALLAGEKPDVLRGTYNVINRNAQLLYPGSDGDALTERILHAHAALLRGLPKLPADQSVPYKKGSRDYGRDDYIETVSDHFDMHIRYLRKIAEGAPESFFVFHDTV